VPFSDENAVVVERTDGAGPPRHGWLRDANRSIDAPGGLLAGVVWLLSRHGRFGRAMMLQEHLRERRTADGPGGRVRPRRPSQGLVLGSVRRLDAETVRRWTVRAAVRWALVTGRLSRRRPRLEAAVGLLAIPLALPAVVVVVAAVVVLLAADVGLWAVLAVGASIRTAVGARPAKETAPSSFDWTPS
jgi:hypothetical protein